MFIQKNDKLIYSYDNQKVCIEAWGENALRIRATCNKSFLDEDWALTENVTCNPIIQIEKDNSECTAKISNGKITAYFNSLGRLTFINNKGDILLKECASTLDDTPSMALNKQAREFKPKEGENYQIHFHFYANDSEKIFGMGQYQQKYLDLKGCSLELAQRNSQISIPFYISSLGYGFLWNNPAIGRVVFGKNGTEWEAQSTKQADYWICAGDTPDEIERNYMSVTGKPPLMPEFGLGFWQCKFRYQTQEELLNVARIHKQLGLPLDVIVVDFFHWTQQGEYKFDSKYWPDVKGMCEELKALGITLMVSVWPTVDYRSENFQEMMEKGCLVRTERGVRVTMRYCGEEVFMDPTNPETRRFVWNKCKENYWNNGVRIFWLDEAEPEYSVYDYDNYRYYLGSNLEVGNIYPKYYAQAFYDGMKEEGVEKPLNLLRCAWAGSAKYGTLVWSGDIDSTFDSLQRQVRAGLSMSIAGIPWWTTDIGGFHGARTDDAEFHELLMRWFAYGTFLPVMRLHGVREPWSGTPSTNMGIGLYGTGSDNEVWSYGEECQRIMTKFIFLREKIRPYIREQMTVCHETGRPVMRPLFYDFSDDMHAWNIDDQYMFGPDMLVAPVLEKGAKTRNVYLPEGHKWINAWTKENYSGGQIIKAEAPLDEIPVFFKDRIICEF